MDHIDCLVKSTEQYLTFLRNKNRGKSYIYLKRIEAKTQSTFFLYLDSALISPEGITISYRSSNNSTYIELDPSLYEVSGYDNKENRLLVAPKMENNLFSSLPYDCFRIDSDMTFLIERLLSWYKKYGEYISIPSPPPSSFPEISFSEKLSEEQIHAVNICLNESLSYVWGAPGTGKTRAVISQCILNHIEKKNHVLLIAPTNNAVDQSLRGVISVLKENGYDESLVLRIGTPSHDFLNEYPSVCEYYSSTELADRAKDAIAEDEKKLVNLKNYEDQSKICDQYKKALDGYSNWKNQVDTLNKSIKDITQTLNNLNIKCDDLDKQRNKNETRIKELEDSKNTLTYKIKSWFSKQHVIKTETEICELRQKNEDINQKISNTTKLIDDKEQEKASKQKEFSTAGKNMCKANENLRGLSTAYSSKYYIDYQAIYDQLLTSLNKLKEIVSTYEEESSIREHLEKNQNLLSKFTESYKNVLVFACTVDTFTSRYSDFSGKGIEDNNFIPRYNQNFSQIFLDEAAYCSLPKCGPLFSLGIPVTMFGDHMQLPPVCEVNRETILRDSDTVCLWSMSALHFSDLLDPNISFENIFKAFAKSEAPHFYKTKCKALTQTYRFGNNLASLLSDYVYPASFKGSEEFDTNIRLIDINCSKAIEKLPRQSSAEADAIKHYITSVQPEDLAILTPYRNQRDLLKRTLPEHRDNILTIHASQGREFDTVILSVVDTTDLFMTDTRNPNSNGLQVINTAISRAKKEIIICCDSDFWREKTDQLIGRLVNAAQPIQIGAKYEYEKTTF